MDEAQRMDKDLYELRDNSSLPFKPIEVPNSMSPLYCDVSNGQVRPYVPEKFRLKIFHSIHDITHSRRKATTDAVRRSAKGRGTSLNNSQPSSSDIPEEVKYTLDN
ncbi:hypothetical protein AVEN_142159-1 [Araneus ventricosus]|uniref:Uncharacterized protein n=1 Tax=Araneus ventricosus TaxID=182803 RepID=A0A4Y2IJQ4_ARAVE|nr:hypothetical protein AVEN_142159-1 [Araneus ventricosus]